MRFKRHMELEHGLKQIDIAPLIDVVFLLLIFFMLTSNILTQPGIKVNLPKAITSEAAKYGNIELAVSNDSIFYINGKAVVLAQLKDLFRQAAKRGQPILIKADKRAPIESLAALWDMAREFGISQIDIATTNK